MKKTKKLRLKNFRGVREGEVELGRMTVLVGANNSAKSTILEALFLLPNPLRQVPYVKPDEKAPLRAASLIHEIHRTLTSAGYAFLLYRYIAEKAEVSLDNTSLEFVRRGSQIYLGTNKPLPAHSYLEMPELLNIKPFGSLATSADTIIGSDSPHSEVRILGESLLISSELVRHAWWYMHQNWANIMNTGITREVAADISRLVSEEFVNITIEPFLGGNLSMFGFLKDGTRIRLGDLGAGVQVYITARILHEVAKPEFLLWDDVEAHMNPRMLIRAAEWFSELVDRSVSVVVTTHSLEAAKIIGELVEDARICTMTLRDGRLESSELSPDEVERLMSAGIDVRLADTVIV